MKNGNRKVLMTLIGVALAAPFLVIAAVVGNHVAALADTVRADELCVALVVASVALRIVEGHLAFIGKLVRIGGSGEPRSNTDQLEQARTSPGY